MFNHSPRSTRHSLELLPAHIRGNNFDHLKFPLTTPKRTRGKFIRSARGCGIFYITKKRNQRCIIKISYTKNTKTRAWAAHGEYLQREHAQREDEKGWGFNNQSNSIDLKYTLREWQKSRDEHLFRLIVSPENGLRIDLKRHTRDLLIQMEKDLKTKLEWAAIDHHNTDYLHVHILIRGRDDHGKTLIIEREYLSRTIRHRSEGLATRELGLRNERDLIQTRELRLECKYLTEIDRNLRHKAVNNIVSYHTPVPNSLASREIRLLEISRLKFLEKIGLVEKISAKSWQLHDEMEILLKKMQLSNDIIKSRARHNIRTITHEMPIPTQIHENKPLTGKVVGMGLEDELKDQRYLLLEGIDGNVHYIQATNSLIKARDNFKFYNENIITLENNKFTNEHGKTIDYHRVTNHFKLIDMEKEPKSRLDLDVIEFVKINSSKPNSNFPIQSFAYEYVKTMAKRFHELEKENIFIKTRDRYELAPHWKKKLDLIVKKRQHTFNMELQRNHNHGDINKIKLENSPRLEKPREHTQQR
jgi:type IV secretory pathway VirD2 relaxase